MKDVQLAKNQNRISKEQFELLSKRAANNSIEHIAEIELKLDEMKLENKQLNKQIQNLKKEQNSKKKVLEKYSTNKKYPQEIKSYTDEVKTLSLKKRDYYLKLLNNKKSLNHCITQLESVDNLYNEYKEKKNYSHHKVEQELTKLKMDLKGNENEIWDKVEKGMTIIVKQADDNNYNLLNNPNIRKTPKLLKPLNAKIANKDIQRGNYNYNFSKRSSKSSGRKVNIVAQNKNEDIDLSKITYDTLSDYGYNDLLTKKEHYVDINLKLERSIKETKKMYERKVKEHVALVEQNKQKLNYLEQENELLVSEISDLQKLIEITEEEERVKNEVNQNQYNNYNNNNVNYQISAVRHPNKEHTNNINDVSETRNDILNDLKELNASATEKNKTKFAASALEEEDAENKAIKFEDISNVEHVDVSKEINRSKVIDELKKKYNIGMKSNDEGKVNNEVEEAAQQDNIIEGVGDKEENEKECNDNQNEDQDQDEDEGEEKQQENEEQKEEEQEDDNIQPPNDEGNEVDNVKETDINQSHLVEQEEKKEEEGDVQGEEEKEEEEKEDDKEEHEQSQEENKEDEQQQEEEDIQQPVQDAKEQIHVEPKPEHLHFEKKIIRVEQHENKKDPNSAEFFEKDKQTTTIQNNDEQEINNEQQNEINVNKKENNQEQNDNEEQEQEEEEENNKEGANKEEENNEEEKEEEDKPNEQDLNENKEEEENKDNEQDLEENKEEPNEDNNQQEEEEHNDNVNNEEENNEDSLEQQHNEQEDNESQDSLDQPNNNNEQDDDINNNDGDNDSINQENKE